MRAIKLIAVVALAMLATTTYAQKFGSVNRNEVIQKLITKDSVDVKMQAYQTELQETYQALQSEYEAKAQDLQKKLSTMSETLVQQKQKDMQRILQSLQEFEAAAQQDMQNKQQELMAPVVKKFDEAMASIGKEGSFIFIFDSAQPIYTNPTAVTDLTSIATKKLGL